MKLEDFLARDTVQFLDGAMGTQLSEMGHQGGGINCIDHPDAVAAVHAKYLSAGSRLIITNSLTLNSIYTTTHSQDIDLKTANINASAIAVKSVKESGCTPAFILGNIGPTGNMLEPYGDLSPGHAVDSYTQQARFLAEGGADGFIIETMYDLSEALCAVEGCTRGAPGLPVLASLSFSTIDNDGRTVMGNDAATVARELETAGVCAIGTNCGDLDPSEAGAIISIYRQNTSLPLFAEPNAGKPRLENGKTLFDMSPAAFAEGMKSCFEAGARILGGCCGTSPDHIAALVAVYA